MSHTYTLGKTTYKRRADGAVEVRGPGCRQLWHPWDSPGGGFRIGGLLPSASLGVDCPQLLDALYTWREPHPLAQITRDIPAPIRERVTALTRHHYEALRLAQLRPRDFLRCPTLILLAVLRTLALPLPTFDPDGDAMHWAGQVCPHPELAFHVARRFERAIMGDPYHVPDVAIVWPAFANRAALRVLRHVPAVSDEHLMLAGLDHVIARSPLLAYAAGNGKYEIYVQCRRIVMLRQRLRLQLWPYGSEVASLAQLWRIGDRLAIQAAREMGCAHVVYPTPPYLPDRHVRWISTEDELQEIADTYCNCVFSFQASCLAGLTAVYEATDEQQRRYVLVLTLSEGGWRVTGAEYPHGESVPTSEKERIHKYLQEGDQ